MNETAKDVLRSVIDDKARELIHHETDVARKKSALTEAEGKAAVLSRDIESLKAAIDETG